MYRALVIATRQLFSWDLKEDRDAWIAEKPNERRLLTKNELTEAGRERRNYEKYT